MGTRQPHNFVPQDMAQQECFTHSGAGERSCLKVHVFAPRLLRGRVSTFCLAVLPTTEVYTVVVDIVQGTAANNTGCSTVTGTDPRLARSNSC